VTNICPAIYAVAELELRKDVLLNTAAARWILSIKLAAPGDTNGTTPCNYQSGHSFGVVGQLAILADTAISWLPYQSSLCGRNIAEQRIYVPHCNRRVPRTRQMILCDSQSWSRRSYHGARDDLSYCHVEQTVASMMKSLFQVRVLILSLQISSVEPIFIGSGDERARFLWKSHPYVFEACIVIH
jgi:hypothetical protein